MDKERGNILKYNAVGGRPTDGLLVQFDGSAHHTQQGYVVPPCQRRGCSSCFWYPCWGAYSQKQHAYILHPTGVQFHVMRSRRNHSAGPCDYAFRASPRWSRGCPVRGCGSAFPYIAQVFPLPWLPFCLTLASSSSSSRFRRDQRHSKRVTGCALKPPCLGYKIFIQLLPSTDLKRVPAPKLRIFPAHPPKPAWGAPNWARSAPSCDSWPGENWSNLTFKPGAKGGSPFDFKRDKEHKSHSTNPAMCRYYVPDPFGGQNSEIHVHHVWLVSLLKFIVLDLTHLGIRG